MSFQRELVKLQMAELAKAGIFVGTSSWKYRGWCDLLYDEARYIWRGKFAQSRFEKNCLAEYAEVFKTVCVDAAYYKFPESVSLQRLAADVPPDFQFGLKVTDEITIKNFPMVAKSGLRAGKRNENYLNADLFAEAFLTPCESIRPNVGLLMFEFTRFTSSDYAHGRDFIADLDVFLGKLPKGWPYGIELRNKTWLADDYFACLAKHNVTHVFNSWAMMPPVGEQMAMQGSITNPPLVAARFLLKPERRYEEAVRMFAPYQVVREVNEDARNAGAALIEEGKDNPQRKTFLFINNRLEGNALETIAAMIDAERLSNQ
jgi:uncharacterized protein YecE (DUF72 family)